MKKKLIIIISIIILILGLFLVIYPTLEIDTGDKIILFRYNEDITEYEEVTCYDDGYSYHEEKDISIIGIDFKKILFFHIISLEYQKGNICAKEFYLEEEYITNFINNAEIEYNEKNIDVQKLIEGKKAIEGNIRYTGNDYETEIGYKLDGEENVMYIFNKDELLIIQIGYPDEGPKFIAYE